MATAKTTDKSSADSKKPATARKPVAAKTTATKSKAASAKPAEKKVAPAKATAAKKTNSKPHKISAEERYRMVEVAAYFMAERNHFAGSPVEYWTAAEAQIGKLLAK